ncbi:MAG: hypothetical protein LBI15_01645 [Dysgonamonadaceae bacterium]|nr:hypothetical protein [Dysgonamonadaceae bacterium]
MKLPILQQKNINDFPQFIEYWAKMYNAPNDVPYDNSINKETFTAEDIQKLYEWKNTSILSGAKQKSLNTKIKSKLMTINNFKSNFDLDKFLKEFENVSFVWKIFLLHIIKPFEYPIYDQHIHRAYQFIFDEDWQTISAQMKDSAKDNFYFQTYLPFIKKQIDSLSLKIREIDRGLFVFGGNLKRKNLTLPIQLS